MGREARATVVTGDAELVSLVRHLPHLRVLERAEEVAVAELRVFEQVAGPLHHPRRYACRLQAFHQLHAVRGVP